MKSLTCMALVIAVLAVGCSRNTDTQHPAAMGAQPPNRGMRPDEAPTNAGEFGIYHALVSGLMSHDRMRGASPGGGPRAPGPAGVPVESCDGRCASERTRMNCPSTSVPENTRAMPFGNQQISYQAAGSVRKGRTGIVPYHQRQIDYRPRGGSKCLDKNAPSDGNHRDRTGTGRSSHRGRHFGLRHMPHLPDSGPVNAFEGSQLLLDTRLPLSEDPPGSTYRRCYCLHTDLAQWAYRMRKLL